MQQGHARSGPTITPVQDLDHPGLEPYRNQKDAWLRVQAHGGTGLGGLFLAEGEIVARALFESKFNVCSVLITPTRLEGMRETIDALPPQIPVYLADRRVAETIVGFDMHRGVLALGERGQVPRFGDVVADTDCLLVLEGLSNHDNIGSLYRSLAALGPARSAVMLGPRCADPFYRKSLRVSMGHVLGVPTTRAERWPDDLKQLAALGFHTLALTPDASATPLRSLRVRCPSDKVALVLGAEGPGLTEASMAEVKHRVRIEMNQGVDSLNVAVSAAVALSQICRPG